MATFPTNTQLVNNVNTVLAQKTYVGNQADAIFQLIGASSLGAEVIASGSVTPSVAVFTVDTEASAASDDLANILTTNLHAGAIIAIASLDAGRVVTVKHEAGGTGQITLVDGVDKALYTDKWLLLRRSGANWVEFQVYEDSQDSTEIYAPQSIVQANMGTRPAGWTSEDCDLPTETITASGGIVTIETGLQVAATYQGLVELSDVLASSDTVDLSGQSDGDYYIYADTDSDGTFTGFGFSTTPMNVGFDRVDAGSDLYTPSKLTMYDSTDTPIRRVYIGEATVVGGSVTLIACYALGTFVRSIVNNGSDVTTNSRYVETSKFPSVIHNRVVPEIFGAGGWAFEGRFYNSSSPSFQGTLGGSVQGEGVIVKTGDVRVTAGALIPGRSLTSGPCRILVSREY